MVQVDTFGAYTRARLSEWGKEFAFHRDCEFLGYSSKNLIQILMDHKGELPRSGGGFKPLEVSPTAQQIEDAIADLARSDLRPACVLRAYYCGSGRVKVERLETANMLLTSAGLPPIRERQYLTLHDLGFAHIRGFLGGIAQAA